jgi:hypothetical protein
MSLTLSGEITAIATAILAAGAIITAILAYMAFRKQAQEVSLLQQQIREGAQVRRAKQASRVVFSQEPEGGGNRRNSHSRALSRTAASCLYTVCSSSGTPLRAQTSYISSAAPTSLHQAPISAP